MKISIIGAGYVGLVTGACFAEKGHDVICMDIRKEAIDSVSKGIPPIHEPGLKELLGKNIGKRLRATSDLESAVMGSEISFICVGTPSLPDGSIDLSHVRQAARDIGTALGKKGSRHTVVVKSTVIPGTTAEVVKAIEKASGKRFPKDFGAGFNPEFLREGSAVSDFLAPDRIVLGSDDEESARMLTRLYDGMFDAPVIATNIRTAEMIKYANNAILSTLVSFANEIGDICETMPDVDANEVLKIVTMDGRINPKQNGGLSNPAIINYIRPGSGFGGGCLPKDVNALIKFARSQGQKPVLLESVVSINNERVGRIVERLEKHGTLASKTVALLGAAFKPGTDDIRGSPALGMIDLLLRKGAKINVTDPQALPAMERIYKGKIACFKDPREALKDADAAILVTNWKEYEAIAPEEFVKLMRRPLLLDTKRAYDRKRYSGRIEYVGTGLSDFEKKG